MNQNLVFVFVVWDVFDDRILSVCTSESKATELGRKLSLRNDYTYDIDIEVRKISMNKVI